MKKILTAIAVTIFIIYSSISFASYVIHLKDGREFVTDRYWEEGEQIKFKRYGGVIGIERSLVRGIEKTEDLPGKKEIVEPEGPVSKAKDAEKGGVPEKTERVETGQQGIPGEIEKAQQESAAKMEAFIKEKRRLLEERERVSAAFREAKAKNDRDKKDENWNRLLSLQEELSRLRQQVLAAHQGTLPPWWDGED